MEMQMRNIAAFFTIALAAIGAGACQSRETTAQSTTNLPDNHARIERGKYLVNGIGCSDCHTPKKMGPQGPEPDGPAALWPSRTTSAAAGTLVKRTVGCGSLVGSHRVVRSMGRELSGQSHARSEHGARNLDGTDVPGCDAQRQTHGN